MNPLKELQETLKMVALKETIEYTGFLNPSGKFIGADFKGGKSAADTLAGAHGNLATAELKRLGKKLHKDYEYPIEGLLELKYLRIVTEGHESLYASTYDYSETDPEDIDPKHHAFKPSSGQKSWLEDRSFEGFEVYLDNDTRPFLAAVVPPETSGGSSSSGFKYLSKYDGD